MIKSNDKKTRSNDKKARAMMKAISISCKNGRTCPRAFLEEELAVRQYFHKDDDALRRRWLQYDEYGGNWIYRGGNLIQEYLWESLFVTTPLPNCQIEVSKLASFIIIMDIVVFLGKNLLQIQNCIHVSSPQEKRHKPSLLFTSLTLFASFQ